MGKVIILDTETSGVGKTDVVIELAHLTCLSLALEIKNSTEDTFYTYYSSLEEEIEVSRYFPSCSINPRAYEVHGIGLSDLTTCPKSNTVTLPEDVCYIVGHNVQVFDKRLLAQSNPELLPQLDNVKYICTMSLAKLLSKHKGLPFEKHTLDYLAEYYYPQEKHLLILDNHTAKNDVIKTLVVLLKLIEQLPALETWEDIYNFQETMKKVKK